jgi:hypothetical protein
VLWESRNITIKNNVLGDQSSSESWSSPAILAYDDNGNTMSYRNRSIAVDNNAYWQRPNGTSTKFSNLDDNPNGTMSTTSASDHKSRSGLDAQSAGTSGATNPWVTGGSLTLRSTSSGFTATGGAPIPSSVAADLSVTGGATVVGVPNPVPTPSPAT